MPPETFSAGNIASALFSTTVLSVFLLIYDWRLALCLLAALPLIYPFLLLANYFVRKAGKKQIAARNTVGAKFLEYVQGIRHLKSYGLTGEKYQVLGCKRRKHQNRRCGYPEHPSGLILPAHQ